MERVIHAGNLWEYKSQDALAPAAGTSVSQLILAAEHLSEGCQIPLRQVYPLS